MSTDPTEPKLVPLSKEWWEKVKAEYSANKDSLLCIASKLFEKAWHTPEHKAAIKNLAHEFLLQAEIRYKSAIVGKVVLFLFVVYSPIYELLNKQLRLDFLLYCINNHQTSQQCPPPTNS